MDAPLVVQLHKTRSTSSRSKGNRYTDRKYLYPAGNPLKPPAYVHYQTASCNSRGPGYIG